jgi:glycosyltransferase involved in cell wall biosynthesis
MLSSARAVIVNARTVQEDVSRYFPNSTARIFALPFAPTPLPAQATRGYDMVKKMFGLPERYFLISNQFWIHKAHRTAFEALARLRRELPNDDLHIVCTGNTYDYRFPNYFESLRTLVENLGLSEKIHFLGYIDKLDQLRIMAKAVAVIQPSLFEGGPGGGAVYDAVAAGVPAIVSNIGVNLEIGDEENVVFFEARSCDDLALKMKSIAGSVRSCESLVSKTRMRTRLAYAGQILLAAIDHASREQWRR